MNLEKKVLFDTPCQVLRKLRQNGLERCDGALSPLRGLKVA
ncbi:hypothetical protein [Schleiferilactobacillus harbinensis]|uniref:Uncharacterized protein n=1 Tax=Schleiferilactobacillus harbinensis TaxID=304207 RepID=A0ABU7T161_9LACO|nr:hypothetical protein [Schleiferilactobacillus harbinensis]